MSKENCRERIFPDTSRPDSARSEADRQGPIGKRKTRPLGPGAYHAFYEDWC